MTKRSVTKSETAAEASNIFLKWGKLVTRITAISATITGAFAALFSSSSITGSIALTAAGASTLAATNKLPEQRYVKTKHVPPRPTSKADRKALPPDILPKPEKLVSKNVQLSSASVASKSVSRATTFMRHKS